MDVDLPGEWWHTIDLGSGVVSAGWWDLRQIAARMPWPPEVRDGRCLDVGTMDGFWAFELERRGASEVVALDLPDSIGRTRFAAAARLLGSKVAYESGSLFDLR